MATILLGMLLLAANPPMPDPFADDADPCVNGTRMLEVREGDPEWLQLAWLAHSLSPAARADPDPDAPPAVEPVPSSMTRTCVRSDGVPDGAHASYRGLSMRVVESGQFSNGKRVGTWSRSSMRSEVVQEGYVDGKRDGELRVFRDGRLVETQTYLAGAPQGPVRKLSEPGVSTYVPSTHDAPQVWPTAQFELGAGAAVGPTAAGVSLNGRLLGAGGPAPAKERTPGWFGGGGLEVAYNRTARTCDEGRLCASNVKAFAIARAGLSTFSDRPAPLTSSTRFTLDIGGGLDFAGNTTSMTVTPAFRAALGITSPGWSRARMAPSDDGLSLLRALLALLNHVELGFEWSGLSGPQAQFAFGFGW